MNDYIYSIYDKLSARFGSPFSCCNDMVAARMALMLKGVFNTAFDSLYRIGIFANSSGEIEGCEPVDITASVNEVMKLAQAAEADQEKEVVENG